jgi:hypothetical protein
MLGTFYPAYSTRSRCGVAQIGSEIRLLGQEARKWMPGGKFGLPEAEAVSQVRPLHVPPPHVQWCLPAPIPLTLRPPVVSGWLRS